MPRNASFWRNVVLIGLAHLAILAGLFRWNAAARKPLATDIVWMEAGSNASAAASDAEEPPPSEPAETEEVATPAPVSTPVESPPPVPEDSPKPSATPEATPTPKPTARPSPKKASLAKATPSPKTKAKPSPSDKKKTAPKSSPAPKSPNEKSSTANGTAKISTGTAAGPGSGAGKASQFAWYGSVLHDRFFGEWAQPKSIAMSGARMAALVRIRIEQDGRISDFAIARSSGNVIVDESVAAIAQRVTRVDPPPAALVNAGHYDVQIKFELNPE